MKKRYEENEIERYIPDASFGLTPEQVQNRVAQRLVNYDSNVPTKSIGRIIRDNICTLFNLINVLLAAAILFAGAYKNLLFMGVILCNIAIGTFQEIKAKKTIDKLSILSSSKAHVVRNGQVVDISINEIVLDDILEFKNGNQIPADCIVMTGECDVNESLITGESDSIHKKAGDTLLSGSYIVSGHCRAITEHIAEDNYANKISNDAKYVKKIQSVIMLSLRKIIKAVSIIIIPVGIILYCHQIFLSSYKEALVYTSAALIGMIPQGLILLTSSVLAVSVVRLSRHKVLVQELYCIETLARVDVMCLDKTGTITEGKMELNGVYPLCDISEFELNDILNSLCNSIDDTNPTFDALKSSYCASSPWKCEKVIPFSSERKWSGACFKDKGCYYLGAPEFLMKKLSEPISAKLAELARENRVLLLAKANNNSIDDTAPDNLSPVALIAIRDVIRSDTEETLKYFAEQGVILKVISGDNPVTVSNIAKRAGLSGAENYIDASDLKSEEDISNAIDTYTVFGRVSPLQKKQMVIALKKKNHTVAMTGDGVNDVLALKEADCSVAMASGSDAARNVSQLVLMDSKFASMPKVVAEGRRTINNIQRSASLFLVKTIYATVLAVLFLFIHAQYPFIPIQLTLVNMLTIGIPSFVLALEPNKERIKGDFMKNIFSKAIPSSVTIVFGILAMSVLSVVMDIPYSQYSTMCVFLTAFSGMMLVVKLCIPLNPLRTVLCVLMGAGLTIGVIFFKGLFSLVNLPVKMIILLLLLMAISFIIFNVSLYLLNKFNSRIKKIK